MKFREFFTSSGKKVFGGKSSENNEELISQIEKENYVLHTKEKGSPFCEIKSVDGKVSKKDLYDAGIFCAKFSQDWKKNKGDVIVHIFKGKDIFKERNMKEGTFGVEKFKEIKIRKEDIKKFEEEPKND